jgi:hypothetical protein
MGKNRRPKYTAADFPEPGSVFVAPLPDGRLCAGRLLRSEFEGGAHAVLLASTAWIGDQDPPLSESKLRETAVLTHHAYKSVPNIFWSWDLMPTNFRVIGVIELSELERQANSNSYTGWQSVPRDAYLQWRWDHDREALLAEEAREEAAEADRRRLRAERRAAYMKSLTLQSIAERNWFSEWEDEEQGAQVENIRKVIRNLVADLAALPKRTQAIVQKRYRQAIRELNQIDGSGDGIMTIEREDISEALEQIACAAKFPSLASDVDKLREW